MKMQLKKYLIPLLIASSLLIPSEAYSQKEAATDSLAAPPKKERSIYIPKPSGTLKARYEYLTRQNLSAFKVRNLRLGLEGYVAPVMSYNVEVEFSDWGKIILINGFIKLTAAKGLNFSIGQQRVPYTIAAHRQPCEQYFSNRTFLAKYAGIRDIGLTGSYAIPKIPLTVQAAIFNCSGPEEHKIYFTNSYGFSAKLISPFLPNWYVSASAARLKKGIAWTQNWDAGAYFDNGLWHVEGEYSRRTYNHKLFTPVNFADFFVYRDFPIEKKSVKGIAGAVRYDYMGNYSSGVADSEGKLITDQPECHRLTLGATLSFISKFQADIRLNYEKCFFRKDVVPTISNDDRLILEVTAHF